ncbi:MAG: OmpH family outer membrane protein [Cyclobacteriaceae bacterium]|jgi:outer membrane protein
MRTSVIVLICLLSGLHFQVNGQDLKIGVVQSDYLLSLLPETKVAQQDIAAFEKKLNNKILAMRQGLEQQYAAYQEVASTLSDTIRAQREQELQSLQQDIAQEQQTAQQQMQFKVMQSLNPLRQKIDLAIDSVAKVNNYTHVFPNSLDSQPTFFYIQNPEEANITPLVMEALGLSVSQAENTGQ